MGDPGIGWVVLTLAPSDVCILDNDHGIVMPNSNCEFTMLALSEPLYIANANLLPTHITGLD